MQKREHGEGRARQETIRADLGAPTPLGRRSFLRGALAGIAGVVIGAQISGCSDSSPRRVDDEPEHAPAQPASTGSKVLLAYFSRPGENYFYGGRTHLEVGNTEVLAGMISRLIGCDVHRIEPVDPYPDDYSETVARNVREQDKEDEKCQLFHRSR